VGETQATPRVEWKSSGEAQPVQVSPVGVSAEAARLPSPGQRLLERYTVLQKLGSGGMGVVLAAYDERLDRRVALKLLRQGQAGNDEQEARLVREAQAMARLSHPQVVAVYDSGRLQAGGTFFIAMEYVQGQTLREWCEGEKRPWNEILRVYLEAARGLAAAHAVGLIHRDFKPANVLVGQDGRVRVTDFGLAREQGTAGPQTPGDSPAWTPEGSPEWASSSDAWEKSLTLPGRVVGTLRYLAPELIAGEPADARSDLFAFCVALYEALYGQPAFEGSSVEERLEAQAEGRVCPLPAKTQVPAWVGRVVTQGLSTEPASRPASMQALIHRLQEDPVEKRRARLRVGGLLCGAVALLGVAGYGWARGQGPGCSAVERRLLGVWDAPLKSRTRAALLSSGLSYAQDTAARVDAALDAYAAGWVRMSREVCEASGTHPGQARNLGALREACLERRRSQFLAFTELLSRGPDKALVSRAVQAAQSLPPLAYCADVRALTAAVPPPENPSVRAQVESLQQRLDRLEALHQTGQYAQGLALTEALLSEVERVDFLPLQARALFLVARLKDGAGDYPGAEALLRKSILLAARGGDVLALAKGWSELTFSTSSRQARAQEAVDMALALETAVEQARDDRIRAQAQSVLGIAFLRLGRYDEALERIQRAVSLREKAFGSDHPFVASSLNDLGNVFVDMGRYEESLAHYERSLALYEKALGPEHPEVATVRSNVSGVLYHLGRYEDALAQNQRSLALYERTLGKTHPSVAFALVNAGEALAAMGRYAEALAVQERALGVLEAALGSENATVGVVRGNLGVTLTELGRYDEALAQLERAQGVARKALGPDDAQQAFFLEALGRVFRELKRYEEARGVLARALALREKVQGPNHPDMASALLELGELHLAQHRPAEAVPLLERALTLTASLDKAAVQFPLAEALWESGGNKPRAVQLASQAQEVWKAHQHPLYARALKWIAGHRLP